MRNIVQKYGVNLFFILLPVLAFSQWETGQVSAYFRIPEVALLDIEPGVNNHIHFNVLPSAESGQSPVIEESSDETLWLNYTSALPENLNSRSVMVEIAQGSLPEGIQLSLEISDYSGNGNGQFGSPAGKMELSSQPKPVISGIGNCYTGDGIQNGHQLIFSLEISDYSKFTAVGESNFMLLYTLTDN